MFGTRVEPWRPTALTARRMSRPNSEGPLGECTSTVATCAIGPRICPRRQGLLLTYHPNPAAMPGYRHGHGRTGKPIHPPTTPRPPFAARARMAASRPFVLAVLRGSVLSPVRTRRCLRRGREPARRLADNVLIEPPHRRLALGGASGRSPGAAAQAARVAHLGHQFDVHRFDPFVGARAFPPGRRRRHEVGRRSDGRGPKPPAPPGQLV